MRAAPGVSLPRRHSRGMSASPRGVARAVGRCSRSVLTGSCTPAGAWVLVGMVACPPHPAPCLPPWRKDTGHPPWLCHTPGPPVQETPGQTGTARWWHPPPAPCWGASGVSQGSGGPGTGGTPHLSIPPWSTHPNPAAVSLLSPRAPSSAPLSPPPVPPRSGLPCHLQPPRGGDRGDVMGFCSGAGRRWRSRQRSWACRAPTVRRLCPPRAPGVLRLVVPACPQRPGAVPEARGLGQGGLQGPGDLSPGLGVPVPPHGFGLSQGVGATGPASRMT